MIPLPRRVHLGMVERHADEAAFLWSRRSLAVRSPSFDRPSMEELDGRLDANLEGLVLAGEHGIDAAQRALEGAARRGGDTDGELFTAVHVAAELGHEAALGAALALAETRPGGARPAVSALAWLSPGAADRALGGLASSGSPWHLRLVVGARAARREEPGDLLREALSSGDVALRARALLAAGELGRRDLLPELRSALAGGAAVSAPAAWSGALLGDVACAAHLWSLAEEGGAAAEGAAATAARVTDRAIAAERVAGLARRPATLRAALAGAGALGDPVCVSWVLASAAGEPAAAVHAALAYSLITGAELVPPLVAARRAPGVARFAPVPPPDPAALAAHWARVRERFPEGVRHLAGQRADRAWLERCLRDGPQPARWAAAEELLYTGATPTLFPVAAPAQARRAGSGPDR